MAAFKSLTRGFPREGFGRESVLHAALPTANTSNEKENVSEEKLRELLKKINENEYKNKIEKLL